MKPKTCIKSRERRTFFFWKQLKEDESKETFASFFQNFSSESFLHISTSDCLSESGTGRRWPTSTEMRMEVDPAPNQEAYVQLTNAILSPGQGFNITPCSEKTWYFKSLEILSYLQIWVLYQEEDLKCLGSLEEGRGPIAANMASLSFHVLASVFWSSCMLTSREKG